MASYSSIKQYQTVAADWTLNDCSFTNGYPIITVAVDRKIKSRTDEVTLMISADGNGAPLAFTYTEAGGYALFSDSVAGTIAGLFPTWYQMPSSAASGLNPANSCFYYFNQFTSKFTSYNDSGTNGIWPCVEYNSATNKFLFATLISATATLPAGMIQWSNKIQ
jgi:hypothetical protein